MQNLLRQRYIRYTTSRFGQPVLERVMRDSRDAILRSAARRFAEASALDRVARVTEETEFAAGDLLRGFGRRLFGTLPNLPLLTPACDDLLDPQNLWKFFLHQAGIFASRSRASRAGLPPVGCADARVDFWLAEAAGESDRGFDRGPRRAF